MTEPASRLVSPDDSPWPADAVEVGRVIGAWGIKGWVRIQAFSADPEALFSSRRWWTEPPEKAPGLRAGAQRAPATEAAQNETVRRAQAGACVWKIVSAKTHGGDVVAQWQGVDDRSTAEALKGLRVCIPRDRFPTPEPGSYYWVDLIGLTVFNREGRRLGVVHDLLSTGPTSVLRITPDGAAVDAALERLIPFVPIYVDQVDLPEKRLVVDWAWDD